MDIEDDDCPVSDMVIEACHKRRKIPKTCENLKFEAGLWVAFSFPEGVI